MALGADDVQTAGGKHFIVPLAPVFVDLLELRLIRRIDGIDLGLRTAAEHDVRAAARHVGGDGDGAGSTGLGHDMRFPLMLLGIQHLVRDFRAHE